MRLTPKAIENIVSEVAGEDVIPLVKLLKNKKNISEFKLAEDLKIGVNIVRNMLYRLHDANLVYFIRKKDKIKGWYIYYWTFNLLRAKFLLVSLKKQRIERLKERLNREKETQFYVCPNECMRLDFDQAMNFEFKCPECGQLINMEDSTEKIKSIESEIKDIESEMKEDLIVKKLKKPKKKAIKLKKRVLKKSKIKKVKKESMIKKPIKKIKPKKKISKKKR